MSPGPAFNPTNLRISCVLKMSGGIVGADSLRSDRKRVGQRRGMTIKQQPCRDRSTSLSKDEHLGARRAGSDRPVFAQSLTDAMEPHHDRSRIGRHRGTELVHPYRASAVDHLGVERDRRPTALHLPRHLAALNFSGDEITVEDTALGRQATVTIVRTVDVGNTTFTLLIPFVNLISGSHAITTLGITAIHRTSIAGIGHGQLTTYHSTVLHGTADQVQS